MCEGIGVKIAVSVLIESDENHSISSLTELMGDDPQTFMNSGAVKWQGVKVEVIDGSGIVELEDYPEEKPDEMFYELTDGSFIYLSQVTGIIVNEYPSSIEKQLGLKPTVIIEKPGKDVKIEFGDLEAAKKYASELNHAKAKL